MSLLLEGVQASPWGQPLLHDINLSVAPGDILGLAGPNGAGKSTLLNTMAGDIHPSRGRVSLAGRDIRAWNRRDLARARAYLPQLSLLNFPYTVEEVIVLGRIPHDTGRETDGHILDEVLQATDIAHLRGRLYTQLSGGERQRVQLARVFAQLWDPDSSPLRLLLLDEPTSALDLAHQQQVLEAIRGLANRGCAVVLVLHDLNLAAGVADRMAIIHRGCLEAVGTPRDILNPGLLRDVFCIDALVQRHPERDLPLVIPR